MHLSRRRFLSLASGSVAVGFAGITRSTEASPVIKVWKSPTCGCCKDWIKHLEDNGFSVTFFDTGNSEARMRLGMPVRLGSCHTGEVEGYAIEGHVPAKDIFRLLDEQPEAIGLTVPAMPRGSPGMDGPAYGGIRDPYDVLLVAADGTVTVFESYR